MTLDQRARAAATVFRQQAHTELDAEVLMSALHQHDTQRTRTNWLATAAVTVAIIIIAIASWLTVSNDRNANEPINRPNIPSPAPSDVPDHPYTIRCEAEDPGPCWDNSGKFFLTMVPGKPMGHSPVPGPPVALTVDPPTDWYIEGFRLDDYLDLRTGPKNPARQVGVGILAGPRTLFAEDKRGERLRAHELLARLASNSDLLVGEPVSTAIDGSPAQQVTVSGRTGTYLFDLPVPNGEPGELVALNDPELTFWDRSERPTGNIRSQQETIIFAEQETRWPLVIRIWGDPDLVSAHASEIAQLLDSIKITPTN